MFNYNKFRELRIKNNYKQFDIAKKLNISPSAIGMYEQGRRQPDNQLITKIANLFGVSTDYLLDNDKVSKEIDTFVNDPQLNDILKTISLNKLDKEILKKVATLTEGQKCVVLAVVDSIKENL